MLINKAYKSLTDEEGKKNFEKYGNPDGPQPMKVSIGLPSFILKKKNHFPILLLFVIFILVIFPSCFMAWFKYSESYDDSGMKSENEKIFYQFMNENILLGQMPFVLGMAQEFLNLTVHFEEDKPLIKAYRRYINYMCKHKPEYICPQNKKAICLFYSYIFREPLKIDNYQDFTEKILFPSDLLIRNIYKMCLDITMYHQYEPLLFLKNFGYKCLQTVVKFSENLHQQLNQDDIFSPFFQFPYFNNDKILLLKSAYNRIFDKDTCFTDFMKMNIEERNNILKKAFVEEEINDINKAIESIPLYDLDVKVFTEGFDDIIVGDGVSIKVTVKRNNLKEGQIVGLTHSLGFTELFEEKIALFLLLIDETKDDKEKIMIIDQTIKSVTEQITEHTFFYYFEKEKKYKIVLDLMSFNYKGVNLSKEVEVNVKKNSEKRKQQLKEIEKRKIKKIELSYFQKMLNIIEDEDEEEEEEEEEEDDKNEEKDKDKDKDKNKENEGNDEKDKKEGYKKDEKEEDKKEKYEKEEDKNDENKEHEKQA